MTTALITLALLLAASAICIFMAMKKNAALNAEKAKILSEIATIIAEKADLSAENARLNERVSSLTAEIKRLKLELSELSKQQRQEFELMARKIIEAQSKTLREDHNREIGHLLTPLKDDINRFKSRIEEYYSQESKERFTLGEKIRELIDANRTIGRQAEELSTALRGDSKTQGDWGEMVLETLLEKSGLRKGEEFEVQQTTDSQGKTLRNEMGQALRPDVVVHYPDRGCMVIDSKVSLTAFTLMVNAEDEALREEARKRHLASVTKHIQELSAKKYEQYVGNGSHLDFVMMFIPNEGAFATAMQADPTLWERAYENRVLLASPTQLMGALRIVAQMWRHDRQAKNAADIAIKSGQMYDKFAAFVDDLLKVERSLTTTTAALNDAKKKLYEGKGNLVSRAEKLRTLGVKVSKQLALNSSEDLLEEETEATDE